MLAANEIGLRLAGKLGPEGDPLVIVPLPRDLGPESESLTAQFDGSAVDLRLGTWFEVPRASAFSHFDVVEAADQDELPRARHSKTVFRPFGSTFFLPPRQFVLASTLEWIRLPSDLAGTVTSKSAWGRRGLIIATASAVHPHFTGCLTLELANVGEVTIALRPGIRICQLSLHQLTSVSPQRPEPMAFVGHRRPVLAPIRLDEYARALTLRTGTLDTANAGTSVPSKLSTPP